MLSAMYALMFGPESIIAAIKSAVIWEWPG